MSVPVPSAAEPMMELNTTPLIDIMLVLLIMFIITIPPQSHAVKLDLPNDRVDVAPDPLRNKVVVTERGGLLFNGAPVTAPELSGLFERMAQLPRMPELQLQPAAMAPYGAVDEVLVRAKKADLTRLGFVGNEAYQGL
ncbi:ExbD/TolR family protein [Sphingomonas glaciei]|uniref:Biopolymer transporter ExbD n=1 Tax=Sphingomonas glaciei TaxID=2938948 RepID=A0ABY5MU29_9SPHN|nr:biopolymer transporter ExbD [Sphingomonas glaciei]UUR08000.1 biopolymer transporter ExbD [Sphingomonas glaciei]